MLSFPFAPSSVQYSMTLVDLAIVVISFTQNLKLEMRSPQRHPANLRVRSGGQGFGDASRPQPA